jgi:N-acetylglucosamine kinase-like BadF-type ATPase
MDPGLVIAADGGNSKTDLVLARADGEVLARVSGAGTCPYRDGLPATADGLAALVESALAKAGIDSRHRPVAGSFFLANVDVPQEEEQMQAALEERGVADDLEIRNDTFAVLRAGAPRGWGIAVVCGAGINAVGMHPDGRLERFLGIGEWSGDWGGGDGIAKEAIAAAVRAGDGRGPATALRERAFDVFGMSAEQVAMAAHTGQLDADRLRDFVPPFFGLAAAGDVVAGQIVQRLAEELVSFAGALVRRMGLVDKPVDVVLGGGILQAQQEILVPRIVAALERVTRNAQPYVLDVPPVAGALVSALERAGATPDQIRRSRRYLLG